MKHYNITFEKFSHKKQSSAHKEHKQHWRQERKNVRENKRYMGEIGLD
jgi:hypothetical protein